MTRRLPARLTALLEWLHSHFKYLGERIVDIEKEPVVSCRMTIRSGA